MSDGDLISSRRLQKKIPDKIFIRTSSNWSACVSNYGLSTPEIVSEEMLLGFWLMEANIKYNVY